MQKTAKKQAQQPKRKKLVWAVLTFLKGLFLIVPFLITVAYTNYTVDPSGLYHVNPAEIPEYEISRLLLEGNNVEGIRGNYNERLVRRDYVNRMTAPVDVIVTGSSRGALITKEMLGASSLFNCSVAGGALEDVIGYYGVLYAYKLLPKQLYIVVDPWMLNDNYAEGRYAAAVGDGYYTYLTERMGYDAPKKLLRIDPRFAKDPEQDPSFWTMSTEVQRNLFSIPYFQASIQRLFKKENAVNVWPRATTADNGTNGLLRADGSYSYPTAYRTAGLEEVDTRARMALPDHITGLENYTELESQHKQMLLDFIRCVQDDGVEVTLILEPISNVLYDHMQAFPRYDNFFLVEDMLYDMAAQLNVKLYGSFSPYSCGYTMLDFYDGYHLRAETLASFLSSLPK